MSTYVMSDLHGEYEMFLEMLEKIKFSSDDTLYVVGDVMDRGPKPITLLRKLLSMDNVVLLYGNHEIYAKEGLKFLNNEITAEFLATLNPRDIEELASWRGPNGGQATIDEFERLSREEKLDIIDALEYDFEKLAPVVVNGEKYILVHAGLNNFEEKGYDLEAYTIEELVHGECDYEAQISDKVKIITGHKPTQTIGINPNKGYIFRNGCHIAIDCGACFQSGRLACLRLDDNQEFYVERKED